MLRRVSSGLRRRQQDPRDRINLSLTEMTARVATLEQVPLEKLFCPNTNLRLARKLARLQETRRREVRE